jgi:hypothetical protein
MPLVDFVSEEVWFLRRAEFRLFPLDAGMALTTLQSATALACDMQNNCDRMLEFQVTTGFVITDAYSSVVKTLTSDSIAFGTFENRIRLIAELLAN